MVETRCSQCNAINRQTARFCAECGAPLVRVATGSTSDSSSQPRSSPKISPVEVASPDTGAAQTNGTGRLLQGRYRIESELGRGGFGAVYSAWDINVDRRCAVKENLEVAAEGRRQFSREATVLANLSHPNLPRVTDHFSIAGQGQYLVMDFVQGEDLGSLVSRQGKLPVEQALSWLIQVADALVYIHSQQPPVLHRDIKPANIRLTPAGTAMLVDFGLVKIFDANLKTTLGARAVTPGYAPPEQYGQGRTDHRTDLYALGATLYTLLTGQEPLESVQRVAGASMPPVQAANPNISPTLSGVVEHAMALEPSRRYQSAQEFKAALQECQAELIVPLVVARVSPPPVAPTMQVAEPALPGPLVRPYPAQARQLKRKTPWLWIGLGAADIHGSHRNWRNWWLLHFQANHRHLHAGYPGWFGARCCDPWDYPGRPDPGRSNTIAVGPFEEPAVLPPSYFGFTRYPRSRPELHAFRQSDFSQCIRNIDFLRK